MKNISLFFATIALVASIQAQTNTFPASGNVGIGTTGPTRILDITSVDAVAQIKSTGVNNHGLLIMDETGGGGAKSEIRYCDNSSALFAVGIDPADGDKYKISNNINVGTNDRFVVTTGGNVGIGTTSPTSLLNLFNTSDYYLTLDGDSVGRTEVVRWRGNGSLKFDLGTNDYVGDGMGTLQLGDTSNAIMVWQTGGNVGIGTAAPGYKLDVNGTIHAQGVIVDMTGADYVFEPDYKLMPLTQVEQAIKRDQHLPGIPSAQEMSSRGVSVGDLQAKLLAKVEELTLHVIAQQKELDALKTENAAMQARLNTMAK